MMYMNLKFPALEGKGYVSPDLSVIEINPEGVICSSLTGNGSHDELLDGGDIDW